MSNYSAGFYAAFAPSTSAPTVINFNPFSGFTGLGTNAIIEAQFSAPIDPNHRERRNAYRRQRQCDRYSGA